MRGNQTVMQGLRMSLESTYMCNSKKKMKSSSSATTKVCT